MTTMRICPICGAVYPAVPGRHACNPAQSRSSPVRRLGEPLPGPGFRLRHRLATLVDHRLGSVDTTRSRTDLRADIDRPSSPRRQARELVRHDRRITLRPLTWAPRERIDEVALDGRVYRWWLRMLVARRRGLARVLGAHDHAHVLA